MLVLKIGYDVCGRDAAQGAVAAAFIAKNFAGKKVAVIDDKSAYGKGLADVTRKGLEAAGVSLIILKRASLPARWLSKA